MKLTQTSMVILSLSLGIGAQALLPISSHAQDGTLDRTGQNSGSQSENQSTFTEEQILEAALNYIRIVECQTEVTAEETAETCAPTLPTDLDQAISQYLERLGAEIRGELTLEANREGRDLSDYLDSTIPYAQRSLADYFKNRPAIELTVSQLREALNSNLSLIQLFKAVIKAQIRAEVLIRHPLHEEPELFTVLRESMGRLGYLEKFDREYNK